jgi:hypothetical protein
MKLNPKSFPKIRLLRLHNAIRRTSKINSSITPRIEIKTKKIKTILDLIPAQRI